jgi:hypothetical protein
MDSPLTFYIIFHKLLFMRNTETFTKKELEDWFCWYAVNEYIPKEIPDWVPNECLMKEYKLCKYDADQQRNKSYQNSCFFHLYWNKDLLKSKYVGFGQYDMEIQADPIRNAVSLMNNKDNYCFIMFPYDIIHLFNPVPPKFWDKYFMEHYNTYHKTNHTLEEIAGLPLALLHTFILPTPFYLDTMKFVEYVHPHIWEMIEFNNTHYAGTMERVFALCINFALIDKKFDDIFYVQGFEHNESQHMGDESRGIQKGKEA